MIRKPEFPARPRRRAWSWRLTAAGALLLAPLVLAPLPALAQSAPELDEAQAELQGVDADLVLSKEKIAELKKEIADMDGDRTEQNAALIAAGQRVKLAEIEISASEEKLKELIGKETDLNAKLDDEDTGISSLLGTLARISRSPPPALIVAPSDALGAARAASLLSEVLPQLRDKAETVSADLNELTKVRQQAEDENETLKANYATLFEEQLRIATLLEARKIGLSRAGGYLTAEEKKADELASRSASLKQLIDNLSERVASEPAAKPTASTPEEIKVALADTSRTTPAFDFPAGRGYLARPAAGVTVTDFGGDDGFGGISEGTSIVTRADAEIVSPADGWVLYKGPYLNYGQIVILNPGDGYSILLAGLETIDVDVGQFVLLGEPIGNMGLRTIGRAVTTAAGASRPTLYVEIRDGDKPIDPAQWWRNEDNESRSG